MRTRRLARTFGHALSAGLLVGLITACDGEINAEDLLKRARAHQAEDKPRAAIIELRNALQKAPEEVATRLLLAEISLQIGDAFGAERDLLPVREKAPRAEVEPMLARAWLSLGKTEQLLREINVKAEDAAPLQATLHALRGQAQLALSRAADANNSFKTARALDPSSPALLAGEAQLAWAKRDFEVAKAKAEEAAQRAPRDFAIRALRADILLSSGDAAAAETAWKELVKLSENSVPARIGLARAELALNKLPEATKNLDAVLKAAPRSVAAAHLRGVAAYRSGDYAAAKSYSETALSVSNSHMPSLLLAGASSYAVGQYEQANRYLQRVVAQSPAHAEARKLLAQTQLKLGQPGNAAETLKAGLKQNPKDAQLLALVGSLAAREGDLRAGGTYLEQAVALAPDDARLRAQLGVTKVALGESEGLEDLEKAVDIDPNLTAAEFALIAGLLRTGKFDEALERSVRLQKNPETATGGYFFSGAAHAALRQFDLAEADFRKVIEAQPNNVAARVNLAMIVARSGKFDEAREQLGAALKAKPDDLQVLLRLAAVEALAKRQKETGEWLERAVAAHPDVPTPRIQLARFHLATGAPAKALEAIEPAREKLPKEPIILNVIGRANLMLGRHREAIASFRAITEVSPDKAQSHLLLAEAYAAAGDREGERAALERALEVQPSDFAARLQMARFALGQKDFARAQTLVQSLQQETPVNPLVHDLAGDLALAQNKPAEAVQSYERGWEAAPSTARTMQLASTRWTAGDQAGSLALLEKWTTEHREDAAATLLLAGQYTQLKRYADAKPLFARVAAASPNSPAVLNDYAWVLQQLGETDAAFQHASRANELAPDNPMIMDTLAMILLERNDTAKAVELLKTAAERSSNPTIRYHYAVALDRTGNRDAARTALKQALAGNGGFDERPAAEALLKKIGE